MIVKSRTSINTLFYLNLCLNVMLDSLPCLLKSISFLTRGRYCRDRMVVGFTTAFAFGVYHDYNVVSSNPAHGEMYSIQHCVIKFASDLR